jgi:hypothetical protein
MTSGTQPSGWTVRNRKFGVVAFAIAICEPILIYGTIFFFQGNQMPDRVFTAIGWIYALGGLNIVLAIVGTVFDKVKIWAWMALLLAFLDLGFCVFPFAI